MHPRDVETVAMGGVDFRDDFVERQRRGVNDPRARRRSGDNLARHERTGIKAHRTALDQAQPAHGDQIGCAGSGADETHGHREP